MLKSVFESIFGTKSARDIKKIAVLLEQTSAFAATMEALSDAALKSKTAEFRNRLAEGEMLDALLCEAFAVVREASKRAIGLRHYDVQILGGIVLHQGKISEMKTGEGKTLVATMPLYLNALEGKGAHVVTVNDYLAKRDREWMGPVFEFLGLSVGYVQHDMPGAERKLAYGCDVTYVTNNEIGFDYLRDNMATSKSERVLRELHYAVIDEVDSILIDEARTPLIISGPAEESTDKYYIINQIIPRLRVRMITEKEEIEAKYSGEDLGKGYDAIVDEKNHTVVTTEEGVAKCEKLLGVTNLYDDIQSEWVHHITQGLRAHHLFKKDVAYVVKDGEIMIVDEFTGRLMPGRRWSDGLHQAVEAKESLRIKEENQTLATITFQNFFKLYGKIAGMTGTASTESEEFWSIYKLDVVEIPPNQIVIRDDSTDLIYRTEREKNNAIVQEIEELWKKSRPVLVGTRSIEKSEMYSTALRKKGIPHQVLNAKYHEMEANIIAQAGKKGAITIATNMAGRGTDIVLGGNPPEPQEQKHVISVGGLHVLGTERHEARRIDNQLRGRCGRQGDPGSSRFYLSLNDELLRLFGSERIASVMEKLGMEEGEVIESKLVSRQIEAAQMRVEGMNFDIRKQLLDYDNVMNKQREVIYKLRNQILDNEDVSERIAAMREESIEEKLDLWAPEKAHPETWDLPSLRAYVERSFGLPWPQQEALQLSRPELKERLLEAVQAHYQNRVDEFRDREVDFKELEYMVLLQVIDHAWKNHLYSLDQLKKGITLRAYGQKDPLVEYQRESFGLFSDMMTHIREQTVEYLFRIKAPPAVRRSTVPVAAYGKKAAAAPAPTAPAGHHLKKIGRNDPCPCGSGKKYKKCHGL